MAMPTMVWLGIFFLVPFYVVFSVAFGTTDFFRNPLPIYEPWYWSFTGFGDVLGRFVGADPFYRPALMRTLIYVPAASLICLVVGYGVAYYVSRHAGRSRRVLLVLLLAPFWINYLMRIYSWQGLLQRTGWINHALVALHLSDSGVNWLEGRGFTVVLGLVYGYLPYMIIPLFGQLDRIDPALLEAGRDLGSSPAQTFRRVTLPLSKQAILAGLAIVALPMFGDYFTNNLLGTAKTAMYGNLIDNAVATPGGAPQAASLVLLLTAFLIFPMLYFLRQSSRAGSA
jgi:spermidine/putrescine transport system permease protein